MSSTPAPLDIPAALDKIAQAAADGLLSEGAVRNLRIWLVEPRYAAYAPQVVAHVVQGDFQQLDDVFWTTIPFGTGGRRGKMYPIGSNAINDRTIGESAQGLADYVDRHVTDRPRSCAIAYDTRHRSRHFAELCAEIMVANGYQVYFLDGYRSTPELSFTVRFNRCSCGIMVTASHNPPSDNAVKAYWASGGQLLPPHDQGVIDCVMSVGDIQRIAFADGLAQGKIVYVQDEVDRAFLDAVVTQSCPGPRDLKILYSPLHGVGASAVLPALAASGFRDVELFGPHADPDGDFPNVPGHVSNPENQRVFDAPIQYATQVRADLVLATDPDCDRVGCAAPITLQPNAPWQCLTGNQIGALLADYLLQSGRAAGTLTSEHYVVKTLVTTELIRRIADAYGVRTIGDLLVGFKWIGGVIDQQDPDRFVLGAEESYGFLVGTHARDKDAAVASMLLAELAARAKAAGQTLHERLDALFIQFGCHAEHTISVTMPGAEGMQRMTALMARFRQNPPQELAGLKTVRQRDYQNSVIRTPDGRSQPLEGPVGDLVMLDLQTDGNYVAVRPSGTEPKVKFYMFAFEPPQSITDLAVTKQALTARLAALEADLRSFSTAQ